jgi:cell wall-associated NlpC family hydrolase
MNMRWCEKYVGLPFVDHGRTMDGVDCWGLVRIVMKNERNIDLPSYGEISATELLTVTKTISTEANREPWHTVKKPQTFDVVLMRGKPLHVGIMVSNTQVLHVEEATASVLLPITHNAIKQRIVGFRRHRNLLLEAA